MFIRTREPRQRKGPSQLGLFTPYEYGYEFKVIVTNTMLSTKKLLPLHNGRGAQEAIFAELKSQAQTDYVPAIVAPAIKPGCSLPSSRTI